jgi:hypothetical protein
MSWFTVSDRLVEIEQRSGEEEAGMGATITLEGASLRAARSMPPSTPFLFDELVTVTFTVTAVGRTSASYQVSLDI